MDENHAVVGRVGVALAFAASVVAIVAVGLNHGAWAEWAFMAVCLVAFAIWFVASSLWGGGE